MRKIVLALFLIMALPLFSDEIKGRPSRNVKNLVDTVFKIELKEYPDAWNPSIIEVPEGYLMTFRYLPDLAKRPYISYVGAVLLDHSFQQISPAELLDVRHGNYFIPSQAEDARIFSFNGELYLIYNDNPLVMNTRSCDRRDLYLAKLTYSIPENSSSPYFSTSKSLKLVHPDMYALRTWEKNWVPFVWNDTLFLAYSINPHEIIQPNLETGICERFHMISYTKPWKWGTLRGGTPAMLNDGEYLAFFHSGKTYTSGASNNDEVLWHYVMGAYTFSAEPPFNVTKMSPIPINEKSFYIKSDNPKRVIYPGGYVIVNDNIYIAYGKDDCEIWMAVINKQKLLDSLHPIR